MLQVKDLVKIYKPKKGVPVRALDHVNLSFPQTGMIFLLGKSGSGKSTLLNILGGLDRYNSGDILIQGKSTQKFNQSHFDSYRNTYVGFIFQEYNILDEFSVGANIALALQLQGQKADSQKVNTILKTVDLDGYGNRKPNELSGGQKQRVAIARALVKNPKIIMADEPTGALDSATGRQVLTTLKKLSQDKLVIVVSHDREFAEQYADRIIELSDGRVIRDVEKQEIDSDAENTVPVYLEDSVSLPEYYTLTEQDQKAIADYIQNMVSVGKTPKFSLFGKGAVAFQPTNTGRIAMSQEGYKLIKSRLPMKYAFKLGASGLKYKKFRLVMTILLSCIALIMFGLADTVASYDYVTTAHSSLMDPANKITYASYEKQEEMGYGDYSYFENVPLTREDLKELKERTGLDSYPVYAGREYGNDLHSNLGDSEYFSSYVSSLGGFIETDEKLLRRMDAELICGALPRPGTNDIAISELVFSAFQDQGYRAYESNETQNIRKPQDMIGKTLRISDVDFVVCGIVDTGMDMSRYEKYLEDQESAMLSNDFSDMLVSMFFQQELRYSMNYSLTGLGMIAPGTGKRLVQSELQSKQIFLKGDSFHYSDYSAEVLQTEFDPGCVTWLDNIPRTELKDNEIILTHQMVMDYFSGEIPSRWVDNTPEPIYEDDYYDPYTDGFEAYDYSNLRGMTLTLSLFNNNGYYNGREQLDTFLETTLTVVGISTQADYTQIYISPSALESAGEPTVCQTLAPMPTESREVMTLVEVSAEEFHKNGTTYQYNLMNPISFELKTLDELFEVLQQVFFWIGLVFVIFASLLFSNFIAVSISYKKQQIGILRAIGSRSNDVFRIFFAESFCIAMINFAISLAGTFGICQLINSSLKNESGLMLTILNVGIRQILLLFFVCLAVAAVASFLPVMKIASKKPIDAIRDR